jgi:hypothetical protein
MPLRRILALALAACFLACALPAGAMDGADESAGSNTQSGLAAVERWERMLYRGYQQEMDTTVLSSSLLEQLTWLYEVDKLSAARPHIEKLVRTYDCATRYGFSRDGKIEAYIAPMELKSEDFAGYSFFLINVENRSAFSLACHPGGASFGLKDGRVLQPEVIQPGHPLCERLMSIADTFAPQKTAKAASTISFKAVVAVPGLTQKDLSFVQIRLGEQLVIIRIYGNYE